MHVFFQAISTALALCFCFQVSLVHANDDPIYGEPVTVNLQFCDGDPVDKMTDVDVADYVRHLDTKREKLVGVTAMVGVDALGRGMGAVDINNDGYAEELFQFVGLFERFAGPWSRKLEDVTVKRTNGSYVLKSTTSEFLYAFSIRLSRSLGVKQKKFVDRWVKEQGYQMRLLGAPSGAIPMSSLDYTSVQSWPLTFHHDTLEPQTVCPGGSSPLCFGEDECATGGYPSASCQTGSCPTGFTCSTSGCTPFSIPITYACCRCSGFDPVCECRECLCIPDI